MGMNNLSIFKYGILKLDTKHPCRGFMFATIQDEAIHLLYDVVDFRFGLVGHDIEP